MRLSPSTNTGVRLLKFDGRATLNVSVVPTYFADGFAPLPPSPTSRIRSMFTHNICTICTRSRPRLQSSDGSGHRTARHVPARSAAAAGGGGGGGRAVHSKPIQARVVGVAVIRLDAQLNDVVRTLPVHVVHPEILQIAAVRLELVCAELQRLVVVLVLQSLRGVGMVGCYTLVIRGRGI